jgi:hypothetical protein
MKSEGAPLVSWRITPLILSLFTSTILRAQPQITLAQAATMTPADPSSLPRCGTYWVYEDNGRFIVPLPMNPFPTNVNVYSLGDPGQFFIGATSNDWETLLSQPPAKPMAARSIAMETPTTFPPLPAPYNTLTLVDNPPLVGTFWSLSNTNWPPLPYDYCPSCGIYLLPDGDFLVDDRSTPPPSPMVAQHFPPANTNLYSTNLWLHLDWMTNNTLGVTAWNTQPGELYNILSKTTLQSPSWTIETQITGASNQTWTSFQLDTQSRSAWFLWATNTDSALPPTAWPSNSLHLELIGIHTSSPVLRVHGTSSAYSVQVMSKTNMADAWAPFGPRLLDTNSQGWMDVPLSLGHGTNSQFFWAYSPDYSSTGGDIPDWWLIKYFGTTDVNPMDSYSGDGLSLTYRFQHGLDAKSFSTPPGPTGLKVYYNGTSTVTLTWNQAPGPVLDYTIERSIPSLSQTNDFTSVVAATFTDSSFPDISFGNAYFSGTPNYRVRARYSNGYSAWSDAVLIYPRDPSLNFYQINGAVHLIRGTNGQLYLATSLLPQNFTWLRLRGELYSNFVLSSTNWDIPATNFVGGVYYLPPSLAPVLTQLHYWYVETMDAQSNALLVAYLNSSGFGEGPIDLGAPQWVPFYDGREQLKENLSFLLRAADLNEPFQFDLEDYPEPFDYKTYACRNDYVVSSFYVPAELQGAPIVGQDEYLPYWMNYLYRNFAFALTNVDQNGYFTTGVNTTVVYNQLSYPPTVLFRTNIVQGTISPVLSGSDSAWTWNGWNENSVASLYLEYVGAYLDTNGQITLPVGSTNFWGLPFVSLQVGYTNGNADQFTTLNAGYSLDASITPLANHVYPQVAEPDLRTIDYYFCRVPLEEYTTSQDLFPGNDAFSPTNTTPLMICPFGQPFRVAGYAWQRFLNGDTSKYAYLGQYFDKAYMADANGNPTTTETGILSEYGEFLPTQPGTVILTTKPDLTQTNNLQGACTVHVIKLQLDVNHNGVMDLSYGGPDNTSYYKPFEFWVNNNFDRAQLTPPYTEDDFQGTEPATYDYAANLDTPVPDCDYKDYNHPPLRVIPSVRDLEDFSRLWVCGVDSNLLASLPPNTTCELSWGDKGSPNTNNPTIDIFVAADTDGGVGYLTNASTGGLQTNYTSYGSARIGPGDSVPIFNNTHFIWCGSRAGSGKLTLTISQGGTNILAQTSAYITIKDIKQMYERWTVGDKPSLGPTNVPALATEDLTGGAGPFQYPTNVTANNMPYILLVHDYDLPRWKKDRYAEIAFKRLYWQGYQGRFGLFRWPAVYNGFFSPLDDSEFHAWQSASGLLNLLTNLNAQYPSNVYLMAHGYGAVAAGEALRLAGTNQVVNTYIAMQGAVPVHAYDGRWPWRSLGAADSFTPNRYLWYYTNNAPNYFSGVGGASAYINVYSTNDNFLTNVWRSDQDNKPALPGVPGYGYHWDGVNFSQGWVPPFYTTLTFPTNTYEIFSYCDEARCEAIGAQPNLRGPFDPTRQLDLTTLPFGPNYLDHNAEFKASCAREWAFWHAVFTSMGFK